MQSKQEIQEYSLEQLNNGQRVFDFLRWGSPVFIISMILVVASFAIIFTKGFNKGLDFTGGTSIEVIFSQSVELEQVKLSLVEAGYHEPVVQNFGSSRDVLIRLAPVAGGAGDNLASNIITQIHTDIDPNATIKRVDFVGPTVGDELAQDGTLAILAALVCILIYIAFRFEWRLGAGAVFALAHDVVITAGYLALFDRELDLTIIASLLSVISYSLNDTIVVFDRMRENFRKIRRGTPYDIMNISLTQTLRRTLMTSATTLVVVICLYIFGGSMLKGFSETLGIGIVLGTISSIYVASYLALKCGVKREHMLPPKVEKEGADQESILP